MAHSERFMQQVRPGHWVVQCRLCPKRAGSGDPDPDWASYKGGRATFDNPRDCHAWWRQHVRHPFHVRAETPEARAARVHSRQLRAMPLAEFMAHLYEEQPACPLCWPTADLEAVRQYYTAP
jgi:hypothetical protein